MIRIVGVTHHYGARPVLRDVDLSVGEGELLVLMGPNGSGKTTLLSLMAGLMPPFKGTIEIAGLVRRSSVDVELELRKKVVFLPDSSWLPGGRSARDFLLAVGRLYKIDHERLLDHVERLLDLFDLTEKGDALIDSYSTGMKRKVALCSALVTEAPILLLDEPFSGGLDPSGILALQRVLRGLAARADTTIVFTTPVGELVEGTAERVAVICDGRVVADDTVEALRRRCDVTGPFNEVYEQLTGAGGVDRVRRYFDRPAE